MNHIACSDPIEAETIWVTLKTLVHVKFTDYLNLLFKSDSYKQVKSKASSFLLTLAAYTCCCMLLSEECAF